MAQSYEWFSGDEAGVAERDTQSYRPDCHLTERGFSPENQTEYKNFWAYANVASYCGRRPDFEGFDFIDDEGNYVQGDWLQTDQGRIIFTLDLFDSCVGGFYYVGIEAEQKHKGQWHPVKLDESDLAADIRAVLGVFD